MIKNNALIKRCKNCGRFFPINNRLDAMYCSRIAKINQDGSLRTCKDIGALKTYTQRTDKDPVTELYRRAYKTRHARVVNKRMTENDFEIWKKDAKEKIDNIKDNILSYEDFENWIKNT
jgi:hypothetical protein